jgi:hypothetical protein
MKKIICKIFGHKYRLLRIISPYTRELKCERCKREFGMNDEAKAVLPLDFELRNLHEMLLKR